MPDRLEALRATIREYPSALVGFSGGVDSALVAVVARQELGRERTLAAIGRSASYADSDAAAARTLADRFDVAVAEIATHELDDPRYLANPTNRCFYCKSELWGRLGDLAAARGIAVVCDGTNASDLGEHRPGLAAGRQAGVRSPLADAGLTKEDVRAGARAVGLPNWDAPAAPCLSSRVQYGLAITPRRLRQVEQGEALLRRMGVAGSLRVRHRGDTARIEVEPAWIPFVEARRDEVTERLRAVGFATVELDPRGYRRGSLILDHHAPPR
jgi:pyridinium-3,5-biscarboxylic acid mononucleotide sulfurtransferase